MSKPILIVLAAGIGSRYGGLKQMEPVGPNGESIIDYSVYDALRAGFGRVIFVTSEKIQAAFHERIGRNIAKQCDIAYVFQRLDDLPPGFALPPGRQKPWGTAHATLGCRYEARTAFAVINADDFYGRSAYEAVYNHLAGHQLRGPTPYYCMAGYLLENTLSEHGPVARGVCRMTPDGDLAEIRERTRIVRSETGARYTEDGEHWIEIPPGTLASMNMWGFTPDLFPELEARFAGFLQRNLDSLVKAEFLLPEVVGELVLEEKARVKVLPTADRWYGMTYPEDRHNVEHAIRDLIAEEAYPERLWG